MVAESVELGFRRIVDYYLHNWLLVVVDFAIVDSKSSNKGFAVVSGSLLTNNFDSGLSTFILIQITCFIVLYLFLALERLTFVTIASPPRGCFSPGGKTSLFCDVTVTEQNGDQR